MKTKFEIITEKERVENLGPDDLLIHSRHLYLSAAKDLCKQPHPDDRLMGEHCVDILVNIQAAIEVVHGLYLG